MRTFWYLSDLSFVYTYFKIISLINIGINSWKCLICDLLGLFPLPLWTTDITYLTVVGVPITDESSKGHPKPFVMSENIDDVQNLLIQNPD